MFLDSVLRVGNRPNTVIIYLLQCFLIEEYKVRNRRLGRFSFLTARGRIPLY